MSTAPIEYPVICTQCGTSIEKPSSHGGAGYAGDWSDSSVRTCYACCAVNDRVHMREHGVITLYFTGGNVCNWPNTLRFPAIHVKQSHHNMAGRNGRTDVWFNFEGYVWHGVNIGDNEILRCKQTKRKAQ